MKVLKIQRGVKSDYPLITCHFWLIRAFLDVEEAKCAASIIGGALKREGEAPECASSGSSRGATAALYDPPKDPRWFAFVWYTWIKLPFPVGYISVYTSSSITFFFHLFFELICIRMIPRRLNSSRSEVHEWCPLFQSDRYILGQ